MQTFIEPDGPARPRVSLHETHRGVGVLGRHPLPTLACVLTLVMGSCGVGSIAAASSTPGELPDCIITADSGARQKVVATGAVPDTSFTPLVVERSPKAPLKAPDTARIRTLIDRFNDVLSRTNAIWKDRNGVGYPVPLNVGLALSNGDFWFGFDTVSDGRRVNEALVQGPMQSLAEVSITVQPVGQAGSDGGANSGAGKAQPPATNGSRYVVSISLKMTSRSASVSFVPLDQTTAVNLAGSLRVMFKSLFFAAGLLDVG